MEQKKINTDHRIMYRDFYDLLDSYFDAQGIELIDRALTTAYWKLDGISRYDGTPLLSHSVNTARIVISEIGLGRNSTVSTLLHDVVRLGMMSAKEAGEMFGSECEGILDGLYNISDVNIKLNKDPKGLVSQEDRDINQEQADNFRDLIVSYSTDPRVILIKLADRLEVMRSLDMFPASKRVKKSWESLKLYAQIAHKLGLYNIKSELEDISLSYLEPQAYNDIVSKLSESAVRRAAFIENFLSPVEARLRQADIRYRVKSRTKSVYSIWSKMRRTKLPFEEIYDIFAIRIIIDCPRELEKQQCWGIYSVVTDFYTPNPDRLRDWISIPKSNSYESLHTSVVTPEGKWVEIQIRSERMDMVAERGIAAHWRYKGVHHGGMGSEQWLAKLRELMEHEPKTVAKRFGTYSTTGEIFAFTPKGDLRKLPEGATLLDFAFDIHSDVGAACIGGRVNHRNVQLREKLRNGDIVEILTSKAQKPKADWLNIVTISKARSRIKAFLRDESTKAAGLGREELERKLKNWKLGIAIDDAVNVLCKYYKVKTGTEFYGQIAEQKVNITEVKELLTRYMDGEQLVAAKTKKSQAPKAEDRVSDDSLVIDDSIRNLDYKLAKCCNPIRGDEIFGFVTINSGITVHRRTCPNAQRLAERYPYRIMAAKWRVNKTDGAFQASVRIVAENATGILNRITETISQQLKINIRSMNIAPDEKGELHGVINIEVTGTQIVDMVIHHILRIKGVQKAYRVGS